MDFILEFSDRLNQECRDPPSKIVQRVESSAAEICGKDWTRVIDDAFMKDSRVNRSYDGTKINDLIRLIRNKVQRPLYPFNIRKTTITIYRSPCAVN
jgi:serine/threonine-protein kinase/endoribonuclease IRE1